MICSACNRDIPVNKDGTLFPHRRTKRSRVACSATPLKKKPRKKTKPKAKRPAVPRMCPTHGMALVGHRTVYGKRYGCPIKGCTVVAWDRSTSTPADDDTRAARIRAHEAFDPLWKSWGYVRSDCYRDLAAFMGVEPKQCHIGMFSSEQCERVIEFSATFQLAPAAENREGDA